MLGALLETLPIVLGAAELPTYRAAVISCSTIADKERCERLLGQIASLEAQRRLGDVLTFIPPARTSDLAYRALARLRR